MSVLRLDPATREWVILAPGRQTRPDNGVPARRANPLSYVPECPFCKGNETETPPEIQRSGDGENWLVRVIPNRFAALDEGGDEEGSHGPLFRELAGEGAHEVVIESPMHDVRLDEMPASQILAVLQAWRDRYRDLIARPGLLAVMVFKNFGPLAGTSIEHPHSQILATPVLLPRIQRRLEMASRHLAEEGLNLYTAIARSERAAKVRVVDDSDGLLTFEPFASRSPFETWILPDDHMSSFGEAKDETLEHLAESLRLATGAIRSAASDPDFNLMVLSAPSEMRELFRWHVEIMPKLTMPAGFELGSGMAINPVTPEQAAARLREAAGK